jgi:hypothetical protein
MPSMLLRLAPLAPLLALLAGCGARSEISPLTGSTTGSGAGAPLCPHWVATHAPVQVSSIPSIVEAQTALATPSGVLVGYADSQDPPVDSTWHARLVSFGDGALSAEATVFQHDFSSFGWTRVFFAQGSAGLAATASDEGQGMLFVKVDDTGAPLGAPVHVAEDEGHYLLPTSAGYSVLESPWDPSGSLVPPVTLTNLDGAGDVVSSQVLLDAAAPASWFERFPLAGGDFALVWDDPSGCSGCNAVRAQRFAEDGAPRAPDAVLRSFGAQDYGQWVAATTPDGLMLVWTESGAGGQEQLVAHPFDANGSPLGPPQTFGQAGGSLTLAMAAAPGGDFVVAWIDGTDPAMGSLAVQAVGPDGKAEGPPTALGPVSASPDGPLLLVASPEGAMVIYASEVPEGIEVFAVPLACGS